MSYALRPEGAGGAAKTSTKRTKTMLHLTKAEADKAIDAGNIKALSAHKTWWKCRRNGMTKTWKTRPDEYSIPIKIGSKDYSYITQNTIFCTPAEGQKADFLLNV